MGKKILLDCPHCQQKVECDEQWRGMKVECPFCRNEFVVEVEDDVPEAAETMESVESFPADAAVDEQPSGTLGCSGRKKWFLGLIIFLFAAGIGVLLYMTVLIPHQKNQQIQQFKDSFAEQFRDTLRDPNSLMIDWKTACMSDDGSKFWSIALIRVKNTTGGYADPIFLKIYGSKKDAVRTFYKVVITGHPFMHDKDVTFERFQKHESEQLRKMIQVMDRQIQRATETAKKKLALIVMPPLKPGQQTDFPHERTKLRKLVEDILESQLDILEVYQKNQDYTFYTFAMTGEVPDLPKKLDELDKLGKEAGKRRDSVLIQLQNFERQETERRREEARKQELKRREEERKQELKRREEARKQELKRQKELQQQKRKYQLTAYENKKMKMLESAVSFYRKNHDWKSPDVSQIVKYRDSVDVLFPQIRRHYIRFQFLKKKIDAMPRQLSESGKIQLTALCQLLEEENREVRKCLSLLLAGIRCSNPQCSCRKKQLSSSSIPIDFFSNEYDDVMFGRNSKNDSK